eukprot:c4664_g1_i2.p1 GENE.c4664_g1_i2~~c4664_g1_i2.p1  ORF type:complete len:449 (+),score=80.33 c4664_g1_i2:100-1347(+)
MLLMGSNKSFRIITIFFFSFLIIDSHFVNASEIVSKIDSTSSDQQSSSFSSLIIKLKNSELFRKYFQKDRSEQIEEVNNSQTPLISDKYNAFFFGVCFFLAFFIILLIHGISVLKLHNKNKNADESEPLPDMIKRVEEFIIDSQKFRKLLTMDMRYSEIIEAMRFFGDFAAKLVSSLKQPEPGSPVDPKSIEYFPTRVFSFEADLSELINEHYSIGGEAWGVSWKTLKNKKLFIDKWQSAFPELYFGPNDKFIKRMDHYFYGRAFCVVNELKNLNPDHEKEQKARAKLLGAIDEIVNLCPDKSPEKEYAKKTVSELREKAKKTSYDELPNVLESKGFTKNEFAAMMCQKLYDYPTFCEALYEGIVDPFEVKGDSLINDALIHEFLVLVDLDLEFYLKGCDYDKTDPKPSGPIQCY